MEDSFLLVEEKEREETYQFHFKSRIAKWKLYIIFFLFYLNIYRSSKSYISLHRRIRNDLNVKILKIT